MAQACSWSLGKRHSLPTQRSRAGGCEPAVGCPSTPAQGASWECIWRTGKPGRDVRADFPVGSPVLDQLCEALAPGLLVQQRFPFMPPLVPTGVPPPAVRSSGIAGSQRKQVALPRSQDAWSPNAHLHLPHHSPSEPRPPPVRCCPTVVPESFESRVSLRAVGAEGARADVCGCPRCWKDLGCQGLGLFHNSGGCLDTFILPGLCIPEAL